eukprot:m51a1_g209 hypothetical protein (434) ;mRNA; f:9307-10677
MVKVNVDIELNGSHVFVAGSPRTVSGWVLLHLDSALKASSVAVSLMGVAGASYIVAGPGGSEHCCPDHVLLRRETLWRNPEHTIPEGHSSVDFDLGVIDDGLPGSHEDQPGRLAVYGSFVNYWVAVEVATPLGSFNVRRYAPITVVSLATPDRKLAADRAMVRKAMAGSSEDPEPEPEPEQSPEEQPSESPFLQPATREASKKFRFPSFARGSIEVSLSVPRRAYGFGEVIAATVHVRNNSSTRVKDVELRVSQRSSCWAAPCPLGKWCRVVAKVATGCAVEPGKEAEVLVHLRAPAVTSWLMVDRPEFLLVVSHTLDVDVRYKGIGRRLWTGVPIDLNSVPRGSEAGEWSQQRIAELFEKVRPCIPWKVYNDEVASLRGPHVQALCVPVDRQFAPARRPLYGQTFVPEGEPLCDEPCFVAVDTNPALYKYLD